MHKQNFIKIHSLFLKTEILTSIMGHKSVEKFRKISYASRNTANTKFHQNPSICSQDIKRKQNSDINKGPLLRWKITKNNLYLSLPTFCQYQCIYKILSKSINWSTRYWAITKFQDQSRAVTLLKMNEEYCSINQIYILSISMHIQNLIEIHKLIHNILCINKILTSIKSHNSVKNDKNITCIRHNIEVVFINSYTKFYQNSSICSEDSEEKDIFT